MTGRKNRNSFSTSDHQARALLYVVHHQKILQNIMICCTTTTREKEASRLITFPFEIQTSFFIVTMVSNDTSTMCTYIILLFYSQTRIKCSRLISSLPGLQDQKPKAYYYFTFLNSTISVFMKFLWDQPVLSYSTHGSQKSAANQKKSRKIIFQAQF